MRSEAARPEVPAEATVHRADLRHPADLNRAVASARPDFVFHLAAAPGHPEDAAERAAMLADTVAGTANLLEAVRPLGRTAARPRRRLARVRTQRSPRQGDGRARAGHVPGRGQGRGHAARARVRATRPAYPVTILRPFAVYGPWERLPRFVPAVVTAALRGEPIRRHLRRRRAGLRLRRGRRRRLPARRDRARRGRRDPQRRQRSADDERGSSSSASPSSRPWISTSASASTRRGRGTPAPGSPTDGKARDLLGWAAAHDLDAGLAETASWFAEREAPVAGARG